MSPHVAGGGGLPEININSFQGALSAGVCSHPFAQPSGTSDIVLSAIWFNAGLYSSVYQGNAHVRPISRGTCFYIKY